MTADSIARTRGKVQAMDTTIYPIAWLAYGIGLLTIAGAVLNWDWFFEHPKGKFFVDLFGRNGARVFYAALGTLILLLGARLG